MKQLKEKIIELVPEIKEPRVGDRIKYGIITEISGMECRLNGTSKYISKGQIERGVVKIIGRPITLEDVLRAIAIKHGNIETLLVSIYGEIMDTHFKRKCQWQLGKSLDDQPKEVIDFLKEILLTKIYKRV